MNNLDVYYSTYEETPGTTRIAVVEKSYFNSTSCLQNNRNDTDYLKINETMHKCGYSEVSESIYEAACNINKFNHYEFVTELAEYGIDMTRNSALTNDIHN